MTNSQGKKIPLSILELASITEGNSIQTTFSNSLQLAQNAEEWGYKRFWLAEHHNMVSVASSATAVLIGYIAAGTSRIRVGSGGIMLPNHAPLVIAEQFGTLGSIYPERIDLGLGRAPGTDPQTARALRRDPVQAANFFPGQVTELLQYLSTENALSPVRAIPGEGVNLPVWILGSSTDSAWLAAEMGLPYAFASHFAPAQLLPALQIYYTNFKPSVYLSKPHSMACVNVIAAATDNEAEILSSSFKELITGIITGKRKPLQPPVENWGENVSAYEMMAINEMMTYSFIGSRETIQKGLEEFVKKTAVDELMIAGHIYDQKARLRSFEIIPQL